MALTPQEKKRMEELLNKYYKYNSLSLSEARELNYLIKKDDEIDRALKYILIFALGAIIAYALLKRD